VAQKPPHNLGHIMSTPRWQCMDDVLFLYLCQNYWNINFYLNFDFMIMLRCLKNKYSSKNL